MIVIGDVHGEYKTLMKLMDILPRTDDICFVGDLIDRGPQSKEVIDFVIRNNYGCVLGNHENLIKNNSPIWIDKRNGGYKTIESYGGFDEFYKSGVREWISTLPLYIEFINTQGYKFLISHSFAYDGFDTPEYDLIWGRELQWQGSIKDTTVINIFGHTPMKEVTKIHDRHYCIDTGAVFGNKLSAVDLESLMVYSI